MGRKWMKYMSISGGKMDNSRAQHDPDIFLSLSLTPYFLSLYPPFTINPTNPQCHIKYNCSGTYCRCVLVTKLCVHFVTLYHDSILQLYIIHMFSLPRYFLGGWEKFEFKRNTLMFLNTKTKPSHVLVYHCCSYVFALD